MRLVVILPVLNVSTTSFLMKGKAETEMWQNGKM